MFQKLFAVVEVLPPPPPPPPLTAAVVLEGVTAEARRVLPGVVGAETIPVFNASCEW